MAKSVQLKQEEVRDRIIAYSKLSPAEKLELIRSRKGKSEKEKTRILKLIKEKNND